MNCQICLLPIKGRKLQDKCESCYKKKFAVTKKQIEKICIICSKSFLCVGMQISQKKTCSEFCAKELKLNNEKTDKYRQCKKDWAKSHRENTRASSIRSYEKQKVNPEFRLKLSQISRFRFHLGKNGLSVSSLVLNNLGCTIEELKKYLESKFEPWMTWNNYGKFDLIKDTWQVDHIKPLSKFDLNDPQQLKIVCHYSNLQPLLARTNLEKGNR